MADAKLLNPFGSKPHHENRLTWAFLVALKYDFYLQNLLRKLVETQLLPEYREYNNTWEPAPARILTQTKWIDSSTNFLVSVLLTDASLPEVKVFWSDRNPVYDGVVEYPDGLTLIVENKLSHGNVWEEQLYPSRCSFQGVIEEVKLHDSAICLEWPEVLEGVANYADSGIPPFGSREIIKDLLSFVVDVHPNLAPHRTFELCRDKGDAALHRRIIHLLDALAGKTGLESRENRDGGGYLFRPSKIAERIMIPVESEKKLKVVLAPADTVTQARNFYEKVNKEAFLSLKEWEVESNLHFSFAAKHLIWTKTSWKTGKYLDYFSKKSSYGQKNRDELLSLVKQWERKGLIMSDDRTRIEDEFNNTDRKTLNVVPGFSVSREWDIDTVIEWEKRGVLEKNIIDALKTPLETWGEMLLEA